MTEIWYFHPSFGPAQDKSICDLLSAIERQWGIQHVLKDAKGRETQEALYKTYFAPSGVARLLSQRTGRRPEETLKRSGRAAYIRGVVALVEEESEGLQWYVQGQEAVGFLERLHAEGPDLIQQIYSEARQYSDFEQMIVDAFIEEGKIRGTYLLKKRVGTNFVSERGETSLRFADAICLRNEPPDWVFEVEAALNFTAIGQAVAYEFLYRVDNPSRETRPGIICAAAPDDLLAVCDHLGIKVFVVDIDKTPRLPQEFSMSQ